MKKLNALTVEFEMIIQSMRDISRQFNDYYLDKKTGKVIVLSRELIVSFEADNRSEEAALPKWDAEMIPLGREIVLKGSQQYVRIPEAFGRPEDKWRLDFAKDLRPEKLKERVLKAMQGRGAGARFKEILSEYPDDLNRWTALRSRLWKEKIQKWFETIGILGFESHPRPRPSSRKSN